MYFLKNSKKFKRNVLQKWKEKKCLKVKPLNKKKCLKVKPLNRKKCLKEKLLNRKSKEFYKMERKKCFKVKHLIIGNVEKVQFLDIDLFFTQDKNSDSLKFF